MPDKCLTSPQLNRMEVEDPGEPYRGAEQTEGGEDGERDGRKAHCETLFCWKLDEDNGQTRKTHCRYTKESPARNTPALEKVILWIVHDCTSIMHCDTHTLGGTRKNNASSKIPFRTSFLRIFVWALVHAFAVFSPTRGNTPYSKRGIYNSFQKAKSPQQHENLHVSTVQLIARLSFVQGDQGLQTFVLRLQSAIRISSSNSSVCSAKLSSFIELL